MSKLIYSFIFIGFIALPLRSQIVNQSTPQSQTKTDSTSTTKKPKEQVSKSDSANFTTAYFLLGYFNTFRNFEDLTTSQSLDEWQDQTPTQNLGANFGLYIPLMKHLDLDIGLNYLAYGEDFTYSDSLSDSTFHYTRNYIQMGLPVQLKINLLNPNPSDLGFKPYLKFGVAPSNILAIRYFSDYTQKDGTFVENDITKTTNDLNGFILSGLASIGLVYKTPKLGFILQPEFRYNFSNSYTSIFYQHNLWAWGINAGIELDF